MSDPPTPRRPARGACQCDSRYEGCDHAETTCAGPPGTPWGPYFCPDCDQRRLAHISQNLADIRANWPD